MDRKGGGFHACQRHHKSSAGLNHHATFDDNPGHDGECTVREQDRFMPIANVIRIMRKVLPTHAKISDDSKETMQECVSEYISFITSEANERCQREQRKTITAEDVLWAMSKLGFDDYIEPLIAYLRRYRELEGVHHGSMRGEPLLKRAISMGALAPAAYTPAFHMGHHQGLFGGMAGCFMDGSGTTSSHVAMAGYDPYSGYK